MSYHEISPIGKINFESVNKLKSQLSWWVKIQTAKPECIYYFGSFDTQIEAEVAQYGYVEDLMMEKASGISVEITQGQPKILTIFTEESTSRA